MNILRNYLSKRTQSLFGLIIFGFAFINLNVMAAEEEHEHEEGEEGIVHISTSLAQELGIETEIGRRRQRSIAALMLYGRTMPDPQGISHVVCSVPWE